MHELTTTTEHDGRVKLSPSKGKYVDSAIAWFPSEKDAEIFGHSWSEASGNRERRMALLEAHAETWPDYERMEGAGLDEYLDYSIAEFRKLHPLKINKE